MAKMQAGRSEESFVLASLKEFVKTWGTGRDGSFQLVCKDGQAKLSMEFSLEAPGSLHFTPSDDNQNSSNREKRRKTPSTLRRDKKRSERHRAQGGPGTAPGAGRGPPSLSVSTCQNTFVIFSLAGYPLSQFHSSMTCQYCL